MLGSRQLDAGRLRDQLAELPPLMPVMNRVMLPDGRGCYRPATGFERVYVRWDEDRQGYVLAGEHEKAFEVVRI